MSFCSRTSIAWLYSKWRNKVPLQRDDKGVWTLDTGDQDQAAVGGSHPSYVEALPRYLTELDPAFEHSRQVSEFNFLWSIFAIRGAQDAGWDPFETTQRAIAAILAMYETANGEAAQHLGLWLYGHIMEASEPYEFLANLIDVANGGRFQSVRFPPNRGGAPLSPGVKISRLEEQATDAGMPSVVTPMKEAWNRDLRNSIFHADYSLHGPDLRTMRPTKSYSLDETLTLINRALAYQEALSILRKTHIESYTEPIVIPCDPEFSGNPGEMATVIVREGFGATGLKDAWTAEQLAAGCVPFRAGRFTYEESRLLGADPELALLPGAAS